MARRGANEGNVYRRSDGRWEARLHLGYEAGRRRRKSFYGRTRREVQEQLTRALRDVQQGLPVATDDRQSVQRYLVHWLADSVRSSVRPKTYTTYEMYVRRHLIPELGHIPLVKLSPQHVQAMLNAKLRSGLAPRSVHHLRAVLRQALGRANRWGMVPRNVAALVDPPHVPVHEWRPLKIEETRVLLDAVAEDRLGALFTVALMTGMRQGEVLGLRWEYVDLDAASLTVRNALQRVEGHLQLVEPKTRRSRRTIALPALAVTALRHQKAQQLRERLWAASRWQEHGLVFTSTIGTPLDGTNVTHRLQAILRLAGLPRQRFHDLRHTCASLLLAEGVHPRVVMETLGHSQISLTMNTYSHVVPSIQHEAATRLDRALSGE